METQTRSNRLSVPTPGGTMNSTTIEQIHIHIERLRDDALMVQDYPEQALSFIEEEIRKIREILAQ